MSEDDLKAMPMNPVPEEPEAVSPVKDAQVDTMLTSRRFLLGGALFGGATLTGLATFTDMISAEIARTGLEPSHRLESGVLTRVTKCESNNCGAMDVGAPDCPTMHTECDSHLCTDMACASHECNFGMACPKVACLGLGVVGGPGTGECTAFSGTCPVNHMECPSVTCRPNTGGGGLQGKSAPEGRRGVEMRFAQSLRKT